MTYRRLLFGLLALALLASLLVALRRERQERAARSVEIALDDGDFAAFARSYGLDQLALLRRFRAAGLTSLAVSEELGGGVPGSGHGTAYTGGALIDQARLAPLADPALAALARTGRLRADDIYLLAYDEATARRYSAQLAIKFPPQNVRLVRRALPALWALRSQSDTFNALGFGLPDDRLALARTAGLAVVPRLQNDQGFGPAQIAALLDTADPAHDETTAIFFGLRNEVLGYPDQLGTAAPLIAQHGLRFGTIEVYDDKSLQSGNDDLGRRLPARVVRVQAISKTEQDKLKAEEMIGRYLLGVRERNVRVVYLRPFAHPWHGSSPADANVRIVGEIAAGIRRAGMTLGPARGFELMHSSPLEVALISLAVPAVVMLIGASIGMESVPWLIALVVLDLVLVGLGFAAHRDLLVRKFFALAAGLAFPAAAFLAIGPAFRNDGRDAPFRRGIAAMLTATAVTLGGALVVVAILSTPATMTEIDRFAGVKYLLVVPAVLGLLLYFFTDRFGARLDPATAGEAPVRVAQLVVGVAIAVAGYVVLERSGNQGDIAPSNFELALRSHLTDLLQVRPRFKEVLAGFPALMLVPALVPLDRRRWGWLFVLAIGLGLGDLVDTFSHLHTALEVSAVRVFNGVAFGGLAGAVAIALYRRFRR